MESLEEDGSQGFDLIREERRTWWRRFCDGVSNFTGHIFAVVLFSGLTAFVIQSLRPMKEWDGNFDELQAQLLLKNIHAAAGTSSAIRISQSQANQLLRLLIPEQQFDMPSVTAFQRFWVSFHSGIAECVLTTRVNILRFDLVWEVRPVLRGNGFHWEVLRGSLGKVNFPAFVAEILAVWILPQWNQLQDLKQLLDMATAWRLEPGLCSISWERR